MPRKCSKKICSKKNVNFVKRPKYLAGDNIHSEDLVRIFWEFYKKPKKGEVYNVGGTRFSNCSIIEALNYIEEKAKVRIKKIIKKENRIGDHIWYVSSMKKFKRHYPKWKQKYDTNKIIDELIKNFDY